MQHEQSDFRLKCRPEDATREKVKGDVKKKERKKSTYAVIHYVQSIVHFNVNNECESLQLAAAADGKSASDHCSLVHIIWGFMSAWVEVSWASFRFLQEFHHSQSSQGIWSRESSSFPAIIRVVRVTGAEATPICELTLPKYPLCGSLGLAGLSCELRLGLLARISLCVRFHGHTPPRSQNFRSKTQINIDNPQFVRFSVAVALIDTESKLCIARCRLCVLLNKSY